MKKSARKISGIILCVLLAGLLFSCGRLPGTDTDSGTTTGTEENYRLEFNLQRYTFTGEARAISADDGKITIKSGGVYELSGTLSDGRLIIDAGKDTVRLIFKNLKMTSTVSAPIFVRSADKVIIELEKNSENFLTDAYKYVYDGAQVLPNACIYSESDLEITGEGSLTVTANYNNGIGGRGLVSVNGAVLTVSAENSAISAYEGFFAEGCVISLPAAADGIRSTGTRDGAGVVSITDSTVNINCTADGIEAARSIFISGGSGNIHAKKAYVAGFTDDNGRDVPGTVVIPAYGWTGKS